MHVYDILVDGVASPVTREQVAELFGSGTLRRHDPCKLAQNREWRTVDEVFPLLKYGVAAPSESDLVPPPIPKPRAFVLLASAALIVAFVATYFLTNADSAGRAVALPFGASGPSIRSIDTNSNSVPASQVTPAQQPQPVRSYAAVPRPTTAVASAPQTLASQPSLHADTQADYNARVANYNAAMEMKRRVEQAAADKAAAAQRWRADLEKRESDREKQEAEEKRLAGIDFVVPLDRYSPVDVGGSRVTVWIHENNVVTFNASVNGVIQRNVVKQKGISHTGADETLIYSNSRASLYYVWEISGTLNHCLLRVREQ